MVISWNRLSFSLSSTSRMRSVFMADGPGVGPEKA
jgi:hypothetical protein